ncbi:DUF1444 family protein [Marinifilum caeruleilacunae]|uniref:DUF1444 family protein n=1 Tax=Marinifilum caeruleilacunae TaxID=2499076 RepID=A0ABX1X0P4_9BACT|nr:DUF1444 family protein [Marinifilum caeruleilacunae]NOU61980.1 DUF1444 family protein [Marinifilum caeruleilacunae]
MLKLFKSKLKEEEFGRKYFQKLKKKIPGLELVSLIGLELRTKLDSRDEMRHLLDNSYAEYKNAPKDLNEIIEKYTNASKELFEPRKSVKEERIIPIVKDYRFLNETIKQNPSFESDFLFEKYNEELYVFYAEDRETTIAYLKKEEIEPLEISFNDLRQKAIQNFGNLATNIERHGGDGEYMVTIGGDYESSLILLDIWNSDNFPVDGEIVIGVPARDLVLVTGSNDKKNIQKMKEKIREINATGDHVVSDKLFIMNADKFEILE